MTLKDHIAEINAEKYAWVAEDPENRMAAILCDDVKYWEESGITTGEELDHYLLVSNVFESTRDIHGYKPNWSLLTLMTDAELMADLERLYKTAEADAKWEAEYAEASVQNFKNAIAKIARMGAKDFKTSLKWMMDSEHCNPRSKQAVQRFLDDHGILNTDYGRKLMTFKV